MFLHDIHLLACRPLIYSVDEEGGCYFSLTSCNFVWFLFVYMYFLNKMMFLLHFTFHDSLIRQCFWLSARSITLAVRLSDKAASKEAACGWFPSGQQEWRCTGQRRRWIEEVVGFTVCVLQTVLLTHLVLNSTAHTWIQAQELMVLSLQLLNLFVARTDLDGTFVQNTCTAKQLLKVNSVHLHLVGTIIPSGLRCLQPRFTVVFARAWIYVLTLRTWAMLLNGDLLVLENHWHRPTGPASGDQLLEPYVCSGMVTVALCSLTGTGLGLESDWAVWCVSVTCV